jgi:DNA-binding FadR family transcriptional regulator
VTSRRPETRPRKARAADRVAGSLRDRILAGELAAGEELSTQDELLRDSGVSMPSLREALRILETEGLITVRRGNVGGAVVQVPGPAEAAYTLALILQSQSTSLDDVSSALRMLEPMCAAACAGRADRDDAVIIALETDIAESEAVFDDPERFAMAARAFHETLVAACGNNTMRLLVGALETLWSAHDQELLDEHVDLSQYADEQVRLARLDEHRRIVEAIRDGDSDGAFRLSRDHLEQFADRERHALLGRDLKLRAKALRRLRGE